MEECCAMGLYYWTTKYLILSNVVQPYNTSVAKELTSEFSY